MKNEFINVLKDRLNCLVVCLSRSWGGLEQVAAKDAVEMGALGLNIQVLCLDQSPIHEYLSKSNEVKIVPIEFRPKNYFDLEMRSELHALIASGVNLIHTHQTSLLGSISPWLWSQPHTSLIATRHIMNNHSKKNFFHRAIYRRLDYLLVMSQALKQNVLETHSIPEKKLKVVNLGLDFDLFNPEKVKAEHQRAEWGADEKTLVIGLVGRIDPAKGQGTFISAAAGLLKQQRPGERLKFVIVGEETLGGSGGYLKELKQRVNQLRLEDEVVFAGYKDNIPEIMRAFDIFVMPSSQEAFGLVAIEAMAMECPIIISSGGSSEEIVGSEEFGLTVRPNDAFDLQRQIRRFLDHSEERIEMGKRARQHVQTHYDRKTRIVKTLEYYERGLRLRRVF